MVAGGSHPDSQTILNFLRRSVEPMSNQFVEFCFARKIDFFSAKNGRKHKLFVRIGDVFMDESWGLK